MTEQEISLIQTAWEKTMDRMTHVENLFALVYSSLIAALATVLANFVDLSNAPTTIQHWGIAAIMILISLVTIHLANLTIAISSAIVELEDKVPELAVLSRTIKHYPRCQGTTLHYALFC